MQILVGVALSQVSILTADEGKVSMKNELYHGLAGTKWLGSPEKHIGIFLVLTMKEEVVDSLLPGCISVVRGLLFVVPFQLLVTSPN